MKVDDIYRIAEIAMVTKPRTCGGRFPPSRYYSFLYYLARTKKPLMLSVELGVCGGGASYHLAKGWELGTVIGYDLALEYPDNISFIQRECANWSFYRYDSCDTSKIAHLGKKVDILFIDTVHTYEQTMREWHAWEPWLAPGAVVCLDDLHREGMEDAWNEIPHDKIRIDDLHIGGSPTDGGWGVVLT